MKKIFSAILVLAVLATKAQSFKQNQVDINLGIGLGTTFIGSGTYRSLPLINASVDYGITDAISVGGFLGYTSATYRYGGSNYHNGYYNYTDEYKWSFFIMGLRGAYHFAEFVKDDKIDLYAGLMLGYNVARYTFSSSDPYRNTNTVFYGSSYGGFAWSLYAGCRYRFTEKVGVFAELGYGISYLNVGVNFKLQ